MITKPTVLVLGAGASNPYGYPLGGDLLKEVASLLGNGEWINTLALRGIDKVAIMNFHSELSFSQQPSVNSFLEYRPEFREIGKMAISMTLMACEKSSKLLAITERGKGFYQYLFTLLRATWEEFVENKLSIITFNYDRSLEHYLFTALKYSYGKSDEQVAEVLSSIPIIHVHGSLGPLPWQSSNGRPYSEVNFPSYPDEAFKLAELASKNLLIVSEEEKSTNEFNRAFDCLKSAKRIYFLGFGYHEPNLKKLKVKRAWNLRF